MTEIDRLLAANAYITRLESKISLLYGLLDLHETVPDWQIGAEWCEQERSLKDHILRINKEIAGE